MCASYTHVGTSTGSNYDLLLGHYNANLNPNLRNKLSRSGNIVYRSGAIGGATISTSVQANSGIGVPLSSGGIAYVENSILEVDGNNSESASSPQQPPIPPPERRLLVRGLSRNAVINATQHQHQQQHPELSPQQFHWQLPQHQQQYSYQLSNSFEQQYQLQQQFLSEVQRRGVAGSQPDISRCTNINSCSSVNPASLAMTPLSQFSQIGAPPKSNSGSAGGASSHQVAIDMSSTAPVTSPQTTRRLLPRIITKKTDNATVLLVGETRTPGKSSFNTAPSFPDPVPANFISSNWRTSAESNSNRNELSPSQIVSSASASGATVCTTATLNLKKTDSHTSNVHKDHGAFVQARSGGLGTTTIGMVAGTTHRDMLSSAPHSKLLQKQKEGKSLGRLSEGMSSGEVPSATPKKKVKSVVQLKNVPSYISAHYQNAPIRKLKHPLEENIFSSLFITLLAIAIALAVGVPLLCGLGVIVIGVVGIRYLIAIFHGLVAYLRFTCSSRQYAVNSRALPPHIFPRDRLAFANDIRWLGPKKRFQCQSILHTLLVFEGSMDVNTLRHLIQTRVLRAETPEGELAYPRLLQKLVSVTSGYIWELDLTFDIHNHIYPGPTHFTREQQLQQYMGRLLTQELPLTRPLWEIRVLPSYYGPGKDTMAILRVHQCLADGMSLIRILSHALADHQVMHVPQRPHFAGMSFGFNLLRSLIVGPLTIFLWWFTTFRDKNMFSVPLPKLHRMRRRSRRKWWQLWSWKSPLKWCRGQATVIVKSDGEEYEDKVSFTSSLDSGSSKWSSYESSGDGDTDSGSEHSCASEETGANKKYNLGLARAQGSPKEEIHTIIPKEGLPSQQTTPSHETTGAPSTLQHDPGMLATSSKSKKSNQVFDGVFAKSTKNFNKSLAKKLSTSRSSLQSQHDLTIGPGGKVLNDQSDKTSALLLSSTPGEKLKTKRKCNKKKRKKRKRRGGPHHHHRHHRKRKFLAGRKLSLASNSSGSSFASSSSSSRSTYSSCGLSRPPAWNVVWSAPMTLPKVARIKQIMRSSYNDVLLSAAAGSVRMYMQDQGIPYPGDVQVSPFNNSTCTTKHYVWNHFMANFQKCLFNYITLQ